MTFKEQAMVLQSRRLAVRVVLVLAAGLAACGLAASAEQPFVDKFVLSDSIQPITQGELDREAKLLPAGVIGSGQGFEDLEQARSGVPVGARAHA